MILSHGKISIDKADPSGYAFFIMGRDPVEHAKRAKYKPPALRVRGVCYTKKSPFRYNKVVQANL